MLQTESFETDSQNPKTGFFKKLSNGDFGLAKTYWLFGVAINALLSAIMSIIDSIPLLIIFWIAYLIYWAFLARGIWNAANKYTGSVTWAILAKIAVVLSIISIIYYSVIIFSVI